MSKLKKKAAETFVVTLSNTVIKLFLRKGRNLAFHFKTHILIPTSESIDSRAVKSITGHFLLDGDRVEFDRIGIITYGGIYDTIYDGNTKVVEVHFKTFSNYRLIKNQVTYIEISFNYMANRRLEKRTVKTIGLIRKMYDERSWDN